MKMAWERTARDPDISATTRLRTNRVALSTNRGAYDDLGTHPAPGFSSGSLPSAAGAVKGSGVGTPVFTETPRTTPEPPVPCLSRLAFELVSYRSASLPRLVSY